MSRERFQTKGLRGFFLKDLTSSCWTQHCVPSPKLGFHLVVQTPFDKMARYKGPFSGSALAQARIWALDITPK